MYIVEYIQAGKHYEEQIDGNEIDIRHAFFKEKKLILSLKKQNQFFAKKVKKTEIIAFFSAVGSQLASQVKLSDAIESVIESVNKKSAIYPILKNIKENVTKGQQLSQALDKYKGVFSETAVTMLIAGEGTGKLPETLISIAKHIRKTEEIKKEIKQGLIQPIITLIMGILALFTSVTFIIPKITKSLGEVTKQKDNSSIFLELLTGVSHIMPVIAIIFIGIIAFAIYYHRADQLRSEKIISKIPVLKEMVFYRAYYMVFSTLSNMIAVGIRLQDALPVVTQSLKVLTIKNELRRATELIKTGQYKKFATAFEMIDSVERQMLQTATNEDIIQDSFMRVSDRFYETYILKMKMIGPTIKYIVMLFVIILIACMFFGIMMPYISLMDSIK